MTMTSSPLSLNAAELRDRLASGDLSAVALVEACIARIAEREAEVEAWVWFDPDAARSQAKRLDDLRKSGAPIGALHGLPVGVKDVIDTAGIPTQNGCPVDAGRVPENDALVVQRLKAAGAIVLGKTVTTELAFLHPNKTRNPVNPGHTPGGSSSGSAAAVAAGMVPLAIGTQTGGSVVRPASFCGVTGFKPSFNAIPRQGTLLQSHSLDTLGVFAKDPVGAALLTDALCDSQPVGSVIEAARTGRKTPPRLAVVDLPESARMDPNARASLDRLTERLGDRVTKDALPDIFQDVAAHRAILNTAEMGIHFRRYIADGAPPIAAATRSAIEEGQKISALEYLEARAVQRALRGSLEPIFAKYDAILCPAALGPAPKGLSSTGDSIFNGLWTMAGTPAITLPLLQTPDGLPVGVQLVGPFGGDAALVATARWVWDWAHASQS